MPDRSAGRSSRSGVRFSIVSAVYNVARYLPDFIDSIEKQAFPLERVEVIAVDDGSTDDSLILLKEWQQRRPGLVTVMTKSNGGQGSARNLGMENARGEWVTFPDPDDVLDPKYLGNVDAFIRKHEDVTLVATHRIFLMEPSGEIVNRHPLRAMFANGDELVDLSRFPTRFHGSAPAAFFRTDLLRHHDIRFDDRVRPNFEDGHFCARYLLTEPAPLVGFLGSARYLYRKRADGTSTLQTGSLNPGRYTSVPRYGYLDVLRRSAETYGDAPEWLQNFVLYEISYYFSQDIAMSGAATAARGETADLLLAALAEIVRYLDPEVVRSFSIRRFDPEWRDILLHSFSGERWCTPYVVLDKYDAATQRVRIAYRFVGDPPEETILIRGRPAQVEHGKIRSHDYFERTLLHERVAWVSARGTLRVKLNGELVEVLSAWPRQTVRTVQRSNLAAWFGSRKRTVSTRERVVAELTRRAARAPGIRTRYRNAWVLMDRVHDADDNAERLFRYLRTERRSVNAWFVLERGTPDWHRLRRDGYRRLVAHGSLRWKLLMLNCAHLISSHADVQIDSPPALLRLTRPRWKFTFLQHGVIKDDLSRWLNKKDLALFVTSTAEEYASIVADHTPYVFTSYEVKLTGMPRFDRLRDLGRSVRPEDRTLILVCPTWRHWLSAPGDLSTHRQSVNARFLHSDYVRQWTWFLRDERLRELAESHGLRIGFLPHPNVQSALPLLELPSYVEAIPFAGQDVQRLIAESAVMVTDLSSMAFNAAYIERPVVYFHFDAERVFSGGHVGRRGYFDYARDGFGPIAYTVEDTVAAVATAVTIDAGSPTPEYLARIEATFPERDGRCCERVADAILDITHRRMRPPPSFSRRVRRRGGRYVRAIERRVSLVERP